MVTAAFSSLALSLRCSMSAKPSSGVDADAYDGPLAWRTALSILTKAERTKADKEYYETAERLQSKNALPNGCSGDDYSRRAMAWIYFILPNLPRQYGTLTDGSLYGSLLHVTKYRARDCSREARARRLHERCF